MLRWLPRVHRAELPEIGVTRVACFGVEAAFQDGDGSG
jgi:hypothetical protein